MILTQSCQVNDKKKYHTITLSKSTVKNINYDTQIIGLGEECVDCLPSTISKIQIQNDIIYILDGALSTMYLFDIDGTFLKKLDCIGQGPGEYLRIRDFNVKGNILYVYDDRMNKLLLYNKTTLDYLGTLNSKIYMRGFLPLENGDFLIVLPKDQGRKQLAIADSLLNIKYDIIDFDKSDKDNRTRYSLLQSTANGITYCKPGTNTVYLLSKENGLLLDTLEIIAEDEKIEINTTPLIYKNRLMGVYTNAKRERCFFETFYKQNQASYVKPFKSNENDVETLLYPMSTYRDSIVVSYYDAEAYEYINKIKRLPDRFETLLYGGGYVLGLYSEK